MEHEAFMRIALEEARQAARRGEVPVGAAIVHNHAVLCSAGNMCESLCDATAHAELLALREAARKLGRKRLTGCTLYVTLEPCPMCAGAIALARPNAVIFGAYDDRAGCCGSVYRLTEDARLGLHTVPAHGGVLADACAALLTEFFTSRRASE